VNPATVNRSTATWNECS